MPDYIKFIFVMEYNTVQCCTGAIVTISFDAKLEIGGMSSWQVSALVQFEIPQVEFLVN